MSAPFVIVDADRGLRLVTADGASRMLTDVAVGDLVWANWGVAGARPTSHAWPCFSPDGRSVAAFALSTEMPRVTVTSRDGVSSSVVMELEDQLPIYLQWSRDALRLAVVSQLRDQLLLTTARADGSTAQRVLTRGSPLFFTWTADGRLGAFVGGGRPSAKMVLLDPDERRPAEVLPGLPGDFCAPVRGAGGLLYGAHDGEGTRILCHRPGEPVSHLPGAEGLMAFVPSPSGRLLARAVAPQGDGTPYQRLTFVDLADGSERPVADLDCVAFFWAGENGGLLVARDDADRGVVEWVHVGPDGHTTHLLDLLPTRDMRFYLRFFEQYADSHPIVSPDGSSALLTGIARGRGSSPRIWRVSLTGLGVEDLGAGHFACYGPEPVD